MIQYEKLGLFAVGAVLFVWLAPKAASVALGSFSMMATPRRRLTDARTPDRTPDTYRAATPGFARQAIEAVDGDWARASDINAAIERLRERRLAVVARTADLPSAMTGWKISVVNQAILYRLTALAEASTSLWNTRNPVGAALAAQALIDGAGMLAGISQQLENVDAAANLSATDRFVTERGFRDIIGVTNDNPDDPSPDAPLTLLPAAIRIARANLETLTATQAGGQYRLFGALDKTGSSVRFAEAECFDKAVLEPILSGLGVIAHVEALLAQIDAIAAKLVAQAPP